MSELDLKEKRELYKAMRSAHDGICPLCSAEAKKEYEGDGYWCVSCDFELERYEVRQIESWRDLFHKDLRLILNKWRNNGI